MKTFQLSIMLSVVCLMLCACQNVDPADSTAGMNGLQQRVVTTRNIGEDLNASYEDVWNGVISTLQLNGFVLKQADQETGYIYGVWKDVYERQYETTNGGFALVQLKSSPAYSVGAFFSRTEVFKQIDVAVTLDRLAPTQTLVRISARFDSNGVVLAEGTFANRFFGLLRKEIFLQKAQGSIYQTYTTK